MLAMGITISVAYFKQWRFEKRFEELYGFDKKWREYQEQKALLLCEAAFVNS
jgi:hypothetical protein